MTKIQIELLRWDDALVSNDRSMQMLREVPDSQRRYPTLQLRALALTGLGRLREAASLLDEADGLKSERANFIIPALFHLETGDSQAALDEAAREFNNTRIDTRSNLLLENKEGALLLWITAAQQLETAGGAMPTPSEAQLKILQSPTITTGRIAHGRWLWSQGKLQQAEAELRQALEETRRMNQPYRMTLASEPLIELLLQRNQTDAAEAVARDLRAFNPERMDRDYRASVLRLRVALAAGDKTMIQTAYRDTRALAGERTLPQEVTIRLSASASGGTRLVALD
jgi:tetratricopeptide (TPR) repeat protein